MFRILLSCSCRVDLVQGSLPMFVMSMDCPRQHAHLNPYAGSRIVTIEHIGNLDIVCDNMLMEMETVDEGDMVRC